MISDGMGGGTVQFLLFGGLIAHSISKIFLFVGPGGGVLEKI